MPSLVLGSVRINVPVLVILVNSTERVLGSGILESKISHHNPIFCFISCNIKESQNDTKPKPKYDYCESNIESFLSDIGRCYVSGFLSVMNN